MLKRTVTVLLALCLLFSLCPADISVKAIDKNHFTGTVEEVYDAFAASIYQPLADENAIDQLLEPALYGNGSTVVFDERDAVTAAIYESVLFREAFIDTVSRGIVKMQEEGRKQLMTGGGITWYDFKLDYNVTHFQKEDFAPYDNTAIYYEIATQIPVEGGNRCDSALSLVAGAAQRKIFLEELHATQTDVTYRVAVRVTDDFNFDGSYDSYSKKGYDTSLAKLLTVLGPLLGLKDFQWYSHVEMEITVPLVCDHDAAGAFRWEVQDGDLTAVDGESLSINDITRKIYTVKSTQTGKVSTYYYYSLEEPIYLLHTDPWYVELQIAATTNIYLGPADRYNGTPLPALFKYRSRLTVMEPYRYVALNPKNDTLANYTDRYTYGADFGEAGLPKSGIHVYRLENRPNADGSNMVWLLVDGQEVGPLNDKQLIKAVTGAVTDLEETSDWVSGKDLIIRYIFNRNCYFSADLNAKYYVEIGTAGSNYWTDTYVEPSCTSSGGAAHQCKLCGLTLVNTPGQPLPHTPKTVPGYAPSCTEEGLTEGSVCADCGEVLVAQEAIPTLEHTPTAIPAVAATCKSQGLTEGSKCADCGKVLLHQEAIPATGHVFEAMPSKPATCTEEGSSGGSWCPTCEKILMPANALPALGHNFKNGKCKNCGEPDPDAPVLMGDADGDGIVTYMDAMQALQMAVGLLDANLVCDMDGDNTVTYLDAMQILRLAVGLA